MTFSRCRACGSGNGCVTVDLGAQPPSDLFPPAGDDRPDPRYPLALWCCRGCGLAQLADDSTTPDEPRGVEPQAVRDQADEAFRRMTSARWLPRREERPARTVREFGSPHGGSWLGPAHQHGLGPAAPGQPADVVFDVFGLMHEPDQQAAIAARVHALGPDGVLIVQFHSLESIVRDRQWNALRHGHFAYYSLTTLTRLLDKDGLRPIDAMEFDLYGGTVLAAFRRVGTSSRSVRTILAREQAAGLDAPGSTAALQQQAGADTNALAATLAAAASAGRAVYAYGAASRAVAQLAMIGAVPGRLRAVADAAPAKWGRRMPGTTVPIISPEALLAAQPDLVLLMVADLLPEVSAALPALAGRWRVHSADGWRAPTSG